MSNDPEMNDPIFKDSAGNYYMENGYDVVILKKNLLRIYEWTESIDNLPEGCVQTTLEKEGYKMVGEAIMKNIPSVILNGDQNDWIEENQLGGFTMANSNSEFVQSTHTAVNKFAEWIPENAQQRRFKDMIERIEDRAMNEEDEHHFNNGTAPSNFKKP